MAGPVWLEPWPDEVPASGDTDLQHHNAPKGRYAPNGINVPFTVRIRETFVAEAAPETGSPIMRRVLRAVPEVDVDVEGLGALLLGLVAALVAFPLRWKGDQVARKWVATVRGSLTRIRDEAERRAAGNGRHPERP